MKQLLLGSLLLFSFYAACQPKQPRFVRIDGDKLSNNTIMVIRQDAFGFLWLGTQDGLNRYDGYNFKAYKNDPEKKTSISGNYIRTILIDKGHNLWVGSRDGGLARFDYGTETFESYDTSSAEAIRLSSNNIWCTYEDSKRNLWVGTIGGGLNKLSPERNRNDIYLQEEGNPSSLGSNNVWAIIEDDSGSLWVGTNGGGLCRLVGDGTFERYHSGAETMSLNSNKVIYLGEDKRDNLWIATNGDGINIFDKDRTGVRSINAEPVEGQFISSDVVKTVYEDHFGDMWIGTTKGLDRYSAQSGEISRFKHSPLDLNSISNDSIRSLYQDSSGVLWVGTIFGLCYTDLNDKGIEHLKKSDGTSGLGDSWVNSVYHDQSGDLWVGTQKGLDLLDENRKRIGSFFGSEEQEPLEISAITEDHLNNMWVGLKRVGLAVKENGQADFREVGELSGSAWITLIFEDSASTLWIGTYGNGLKRTRVNESLLENPLVFEEIRKGDGSGLSDNRPFCIYESHSGEIWVGTNGGGVNFTKIDSGNISFTNLRNASDDLSTLSHDSTFTIHEDAQENMWIGTAAGLNKLSRAERNSGNYKFKVYRAKDGLISEVICGILGDGRGNLWLSTGKGLACFNTKKETFRNYDVRDGLQSNDFNPGAHFQSIDGEMFFGGLNGLNAFFPDQVKDDSFIPPIVITDLLIFNKSVSLKRVDAGSPLEKVIHQTKEITFGYKDSVIALQFAALHFAIPERNKYAYKLENFNEDWIETGAENRLATFTNLDAGEYVFRVKGTNKDGIWNEQGAALGIIVEPPPWKTWWAYTLYMLAGLGVVFAYVRFQMQQLEAERSVSNRLRELDRMKDEFLANTSHELRTPLNGIIGLTESLVAGAAGEINERVKTDLSLVVASGKRLAHLVNEILDFSKLKSAKMTLRRRPVELRSLAEVVITLTTPLIGYKDLEVNNEIGKDMPLVDADEDRLQQIFYNLIGNAIKFTEKGTVHVRASIKNNMMAISVIDTGIGIRQQDLNRIFHSFEQAETSDTRQHGGTGIGLALTRQLVMLHGGVIEVESTPGVGSTFTFTLPIADDQNPAPGPEPQPVSRVNQYRHEADTVAAQLMESPLETVHTNPAVEDEDFHPEAFTILIVDDEPVNCRVLTNFLTLEKYKVLLAESGQEALDQVEKHKEIDLVLLDVMMPRMSGYEVCRRLRDTHSVHELPIIFLTAKDQVSDLVTGFAMGANDFLTKPFNQNELMSRVKTHVQLLDVNRNLEQRVEERTDELKQKNKEILMAQQQMVMQEKMASLGVLTAGVAHEINNPTNFAHVSAQNLEIDLANFKTFLMELADDAGEELLMAFSEKFENLFSHLGIVMEGTNRIKQIVRDLRVFSRLDESERKRVKLGDSLVSTLNLVKTKYREITEFDVDLSENPEIDCWPAQLNQVFMNLIVNGCQAIQSKMKAENSRTPGLMSMSLNIREPWVVLRFSDSGCGIPDEIRDKIFEPFFTTKDVGEGTGLGLSISYGIIQKHHGKMEVDSTPGEGTTFTLYLPLDVNRSLEDA